MRMPSPTKNITAMLSNCRQLRVRYCWDAGRRQRKPFDDHIPRLVRKEEHGRFAWDAPEDEEVHAFDQLASSVGTYL